MKKRLIAICLVALMLPACISVVHANEGYALSLRNFMPEHILGFLGLKFRIDGEQKPVFILDHDPSQGKVDYVSWISYDTLSEISLGWKTASVIVFNASMNAYFLRVSYVPTVSNDGQLKYCALGTSNGYCYGTRATEKSEVHIDNSVTIKKTTVINNPYIQSVIRSASKTAETVETGMRNIIDWLSLQCEATMLVNKRLDVTNDLLYWIANNFQDMLYAIGQADLLIAEVGIYQLENLFRILDFLVAINQNQVFAHSVQYQFFYDLLSRLDSVISNGAVQVNTTALEAKLDKLISMYSKVNSVVLDTAAINGGQIKAAVGGELEDVMFWGNSGRANSNFITNTVQYTLNGATQHVAGVSLCGLQLGTSVPGSVHVDDLLIDAGIWQSGGKYRISDTYNAATGELVQRLGSTVYDGSEAWKMTAKTDGVNLFYLADSAFDAVQENIFCYPSRARYTYSPYASAFNAKQNAASAYTNNFTVWGGYIRFCVPADEFPDLAAWQKALKSIHAAGSPLEIWFVRPVAVRSMLDRATIAIPEGDSTISADYIRITGKYETYDSYTQTADIIAAINRLNGTGIGGDLTAVTSRLDTLINKTSDTVVNVVNNTTYITNVFQLDDDTNVVDTTKDGVGKVSGLFKWLWNNTFKGAFAHADITKLDGLL